MGQAPVKPDACPIFFIAHREPGDYAYMQEL